MEHRKPHEIPRHGAGGRERLARLADYIEGLPSGKLTFARWYGQGRGCAIGMAAANEPWFLAQGLRLEGEESLKDCRPRFGEVSDWDAVAAFFDISQAEARQLFDRAGYDGQIRPEPRRVATNIRAFLVRTAPETATETATA